MTRLNPTNLRQSESVRRGVGSKSAKTPLFDSIAQSIDHNVIVLGHRVPDTPRPMFVANRVWVDVAFVDGEPPEVSIAKYISMSTLSQSMQANVLDDVGRMTGV